MSNREVFINKVENDFYLKGKEIVEVVASTVRSYEDAGCPMEALLDIDFDEILEKALARVKEDKADDIKYIEQVFDGEWPED